MLLLLVISLTNSSFVKSCHQKTQIVQIKHRLPYDLSQAYSFRDHSLRLPRDVLCISNSEQVLRTLFAGRNRLSEAKTTFSVTNGTIIQSLYPLHHGGYYDFRGK